MAKIRLVALFAILVFSPHPASAWNIPAHMLSGAIAYQELRQENPQIIEKVTAVLEKHPWYATQWQARLQEVPAVNHGLVLFMQGARWADDIRFRTSSTTGGRGTTLTGHLSRKDNRRACKSKTATR
jgi:hypothetical protein